MNKSILLLKPPPLSFGGTPISVLNYGPPVGLLCLKKYLEMHDFCVDVHIVDVYEEAELAVGYGIVGISALTATRDAAYRLAKEVRQCNPQATIVMGGPHCTDFSREILQAHPYIDCIVEGEGEIPLLRLARGDSWGDIPGLAWLDASGIYHCMKRDGLFCDINDVISLDYDCIDLEKRYLAVRKPSTFHYNQRYLAFAADSRGCKGSCIFCSTPQTWGHCLRLADPVRLVDEIERLSGYYDVNSFFFNSDNFVAVPDWVRAVCREILRRKLEIFWWCIGRVDFGAMDILPLMAEAGCYQVKYGVESGSAKIQKLLGKHIRFSQVRQTIDATSKAGMKAGCGFMVGFPGETEADMEETVRFANELELDVFSYTATMLFPGTAIFRRAIREGKVGVEEFLTEGWDESREDRKKGLVCRETLPVYVPDGFSHAGFLELCRANYHRIVVRNEEFM